MFKRMFGNKKKSSHQQQQQRSSRRSTAGSASASTTTSGSRSSAHSGSTMQQLDRAVQRAVERNGPQAAQVIIDRAFDAAGAGSGTVARSSGGTVTHYSGGGRSTHRTPGSTSSSSRSSRSDASTATLTGPRYHAPPFAYESAQSSSSSRYSDARSSNLYGSGTGTGSTHRSRSSAASSSSRQSESTIGWSRLNPEQRALVRRHDSQRSGSVPSSSQYSASTIDEDWEDEEEEVEEIDRNSPDNRANQPRYDHFRAVADHPVPGDPYGDMPAQYALPPVAGYYGIPGPYDVPPPVVVNNFFITAVCECNSPHAQGCPHHSFRR